MWKSLIPVGLLSALFSGVATGDAARAEQVRLDVSATHPTMLSGEKKLNYLRVALTGFELPSDEERAAVNVAIVLDKSGSMRGTKIERAKEAAINAIGRLKETDIVSVVLYDSGVSVLVPATRASDRDAIAEAIRQIKAEGNTALFAGVSKGAAEVRKFQDEDSVNRVILLSDGKANRGPSSTAELADLGTSLLKEGITVTTLGLGDQYNEDLMTALATAANGNHAYIQEPGDTVAVFNNEFDDILSVVATDFEIEAKLDQRVRPVRVIGSDGDIEGQRVTIPLGQLYSKQVRNFFIEVEVQPGDAGTTRPLADVTVRYRNLQTETFDQLASSLQVRFTEDASQVEADVNAEALAFCTLQLSSLVNRQATLLRDSGRVEEAQRLLMQNSLRLQECKLKCADAISQRAVEALDFGIEGNRAQAQVITDSSRWLQTRKSLRQFQNVIEAEQRYSGQGRIGLPQQQAQQSDSEAKPKQGATSSGGQNL
jgi:Ca-activated chloride channel family protein